MKALDLLLKKDDFEITLSLSDFITRATNLIIMSASMVQSEKSEPIISFHQNNESFYFKLSDLAGTVLELLQGFGYHLQGLQVSLTFSMIHQFQNKYCVFPE